MKNLIGNIILYTLLLSIFFICIYESGDYSHFAEPSKHGGKIFLFLFGVVYLIYTLIVILLRPETFGFVSLISGVVIFDSMDLMTNLVFIHIILSVYFLLWIYFFFITGLYRDVFNKGEVLIALFVASTFISAFTAENKALAFGYTYFTMTLFLLVVLSTSRMVKRYIQNGRNIGNLIGASLINMSLLSLVFFLYEILGRGLNPVQLIALNFSREFTGKVILTCGFMEPAGFSIFSSVFVGYFICILFFYKKKEKISDVLSNQAKYSFLNLKQFPVSVLVWVMLCYGVFLMIISASRSGVLGFVFVVTIFFICSKKLLGLKIKLGFYQKMMLIIFLVLGSFVVLLRSANLFNSFTAFEGNNDTSAMYLVETLINFEYLIENFNGTGAMNSNIHNLTNWDGDVSAKNFMNVFSNLFALGGTFGWISMFLYLSILCISYSSLKRFIKDSETSLGDRVVLIICFSFFLFTILPFGFRIGPYTNWSPVFTASSIIESIYYQPKTYPIILGGIIIGPLIAISTNYRFHNLKSKL